MKKENNEYDGGIIDRACPDCGQYCKVPKYYKPYFGDKSEPRGCYAISYCNRCKKKVKLSVEFI